MNLPYRRPPGRRRAGWKAGGTGSGAVNRSARNKWLPSLPGGVFTVLLLAAAATAVAAGASDEWLDRWFAAQADLRTWSADFVQTRSLAALAQPLQATGRVWVAMPDRFRWELGQPPQTIALRQPDQLWVVYPRLKRAERYPLNDSQTGPWREALALLEAGFPRNRADFDSRFRLLSTVPTNANLQVTLQPRSAAARRLMTEIRVLLRTNDFSLEANDVKFSDGSSLRIAYHGAACNPVLPAGCFEATFGDDVTVVEPLHR